MRPHDTEVLMLVLTHAVDRPTAERFLRLRAQPVDALGLDYYGMPAVDPHAVLQDGSQPWMRDQGFDGLNKLLLSGKEKA